MRLWNYSISYDEMRDEFFAIVDDGDKPADIVFTIDSTEEMIDYIEKGIMKHVDDCDGLELYLKAQNIIGKEDAIFVEEYALY